MKIVPGIARPDAPAPAATSEVSRTGPASPAASPPAVGTLQSAALKPALDAMRELPEIDHEKIAWLRDALAKGELPFDAAKLAALIERYHGARK